MPVAQSLLLVNDVRTTPASPINITGQSFIRAAAFFTDYVPSDVDTHSYIFLRDVPAAVLAEYPRYLRALALRGERALRRIVEPLDPG